MSWFSRIANAFRPGRTAAGLDEEMEFHISQRIADLVRGGMSVREAGMEARRQFGNRLNLRESSYDVKSAAWLDAFLRDFRFGLRMLAKYRIASVAAIASLALAIGACTTAFSLIDALVFRPLPVPAPSQLIAVVHIFPAFFSPDNQPHESDSFSYPLYELLRDAASDHADLFAMSLHPGFQAAQFDDAGGAGENVRAESISGRGFEILGAKPAFGRLIGPADDALAGHPVAVLSNAFWKRRFGASPAAIGRWVTLGRKQFQIVGVVAGPFSGVAPGYLTDLWLPLSADTDAREMADPDGGYFNVWGRLHAGADVARIRERLQAVLTNFRRERARINPPRNLHGDALRQFTDAPLRILTAASGRDSLFRAQFRRPLEILALICALLLLVACSNVANLMIARASARSAEMALRISLGAARSRLIQQMLVESAQVAAAAGALGLLFAALAAPPMVAHLGTTEFPAWLDVGLGARALTFAGLLSLLTVLLFGVAPALRASSVSPGAALNSGGAQIAGRTGSLRWILAAQVGFSVAVLFLSGLLLVSFRNLVAVDLGFARDNVVLFDLRPRDPENHGADSGATLLEHIRQLPAVESASLSQQRPMGGAMVWIMQPFVRFPGRARETLRPVEVPVSQGFFSAMRIRWMAGRDFLPEEIAQNSPAVIVNQAFVDKFLRGQNPIGQRFLKLGDDPAPIPQQIVGVAANTRFNNLREMEGPAIFTPLRDAAGATLNIRTASRPASLISWLRKEIETAAPALRVTGTILLADQIDNTMIGERLLALLAGFFSVVALLLAAVGLYGVVNYAAVRRTREIGIRIALGARRESVVRLIVSGAATPVIAGIALGIAGGLGLARYLAAQLFGVKPAELWSIAAPVACLLIAALAAVLPPARARRQRRSARRAETRVKPKCRAGNLARSRLFSRLWPPKRRLRPGLAAPRCIFDHMRAKRPAACYTPRSMSPSEQGFLNPAAKPYRFIILAFAALMAFGSYFAYDSVGAIETNLIKAFHTDATAIGAMYTMYSVAAVVAVLAGGVLIDRVGVRRASLIFSGFVVVGAAMVASAPSLAVLDAGRVIFGIGSESMIVAQSAITARWFTGKELAMAFGITLTIARLGTLFSFNVEELVATRLGWRGALWVAAGLCVFSFICNWIYTLMDHHAEPILKLPEAGSGDKISWGDIGKFRPSYWFAVGICVTFYSAIFPFTALATKFFNDKWGMPMASGEGLGFMAGVFYNFTHMFNTAQGVTSIIIAASMVLAPFAGNLVDQVGHRATLMVIGSLLMIPAHLLLGLTHLSPVLSMIVLGAAFVLVPACIWPSVAVIVEPQRVGTAYGVMTAIQNIGLAAFPSANGALHDATGNFTASQIMFAGLGFCGLLFSLLLLRADKREGGHLERGK